MVAEFGLDAPGDVRAAAEGRLVLVPVGRLDPRALRCLEQAWRITAGERRALHVVTDGAAAQALDDEWVGRDLAVPLHFAEDDGGIAATVARVVAMELATGVDEVVVLLGRRVVPGRLARLAHRRTADAIGRQVMAMPCVQVGMVNVHLP
jgi:hypothetical protein